MNDDGDDNEIPPEIRKLLEILDADERDILQARFGLDRGEPRTLEEVSNMFATTRERIRAIEETALGKLRNHREGDD